MTSTGRRRVVVGYDGSRSAGQALQWAADRASRRGLPLEIVHAVEVWPYDALGRDAAAPDLGASPRVASHAVVDRAVARLQADDPSLEITTYVEAASPGGLLVARSAGADSVVVGARGHGGFAALRLGSVGPQLAAHAACPVLVVRESGATGVVVGVDGSAASDEAVGFAFAEADLAREPLTAVHAWLPSYAPAGDLAFYDDVRPADDREAAVLSEGVAGWCEKYPDVVVREVVRGAHPVAALTEASASARLLVVGARGRGGFSGLMLGSVSRAVLHHAACTVAVVRGEAP